MARIVDRFIPAQRPVTFVLVALLAAGCGGGTPSAPLASAGPTSGAAAASSPPQSEGGVPPLGDVAAYKGDPARTGVQAGPGPLAAPDEVWRANIECAVGDHTPVLASGILVIGCDAAKIVALDARTGEARWSDQLAGVMLGSAGIDGGAVYVADAGRRLSKRDLATGEELWSRTVSPFRHPVVVDDTLYVGTTDGQVLALDPADGRERWSWRAPVGAAEVVASVAGDTLYASADDGHLYALSRVDGIQAWQFQVLTGAASTPAATPDAVFVAALEAGEPGAGRVFALDPATGTERWRFESPSGSQVAPPTVSDGIVYAPSQEDGLFALDAATGQVRWNDADIGRMTGQPPAIAGTAVYAAADRSVAAYDRTTGRRLWSVDHDSGLDNGMVVSGGMAFVGDNAGDIVAYAESDLVAKIQNALPAPTAAAAPTTLPPPVEVLALLRRFDPAINGLEHPSGIDVGPDGALYVVNGVAGEVLQLDPADGSVVRRIGEPGSGPGQFNFLRDPSDAGSVIGGVAVTPDGEVYVADTVNKRVQRFDATGTQIGQWGRFGDEDGQFLEPFGVAIAPNGDVYVVDDVRDDIQRFTADGTYIRTIGEHGPGDGQLDYTSFLAVGPDGTLYNADWDNHRVQAWNDAGEFLWTMGSEGIEPGQFIHPGAVDVDAAGRIYVADTDNDRVQVFAPDRTPLGSFHEPGRDMYGLAVGDGVVYTTGRLPTGPELLEFKILEP